jgi:acetyltransferase-like isoleucine patch superfamily enzyme
MTAAFPCETAPPERQITYRHGLPSPPAFLRIARAFPNLIAAPFFRRWLLRRLPHVQASQITPGFYAVMPQHLHAQDSKLNDTQFINYAPVHIGRGTRFSGQNLLLTSTHDPVDFDIVHAKPIVIEENVWITYRCIILGGVTIGRNSVIGAGSVVTRDIPPDVVAAGNPCRVIRPIRGT